MRRGFTLIETLVAISVLLVAIAGPLTIAARGLSAAALAKQQLTATYLAQEAVEYVRNVRDSSGSTWLTELDPCVAPDTCIIDVPVPALFVCSGACPLLRQDATSGRYGYTGTWAESSYTRTITIQDVSGNTDEKEIVVTVSFASGIASKSIVVREHLLNNF